MATTTPNFGWAVPTSTDLVKDGAVAIETLGDSIDASLLDLKGGTTNQVLAKNSNTDMDFKWVADASGIPATIIDAKGDLIAGTAADTAARLAVGNNGETLVADASQASGLRYNAPLGSLANPVINGGMDNWQRGTSISVSASSSPYTADRWQISTGANQALTVSRQATGDTTNLPNIQYAARVQRNSGQTGTGVIAFVQSFETNNCVPFAGKVVTVSFYARAGANYSTIGSGLNLDFISGTGTDQNRIAGGYTGNANVFSSGVTLTTSWQRFVFTGTLPATATEFATYFIYTPTGTAGANDYFDLTGVQIDVGTYTASSAPTFRRSGGTIQGELAACQRYYYRPTAGTSFAPFAAGLSFNTTNANVVVFLPVPLRTSTPTALDFSSLALSQLDASYAVTALTLNQSTNQVVNLAVTVSSGLTAYRSYLLVANATTAAFIGLSAEL